MHFVLAWVIVLFTGVCTADMMGYNSSFRVSSSADLVTAAETRDGHDYSTIQLNITSVQTPYYITSVEKRVRIPLSTSDERMVISAANINDYTVFHPADAAQYTQQTIPFGQYLHFGPLDPTKAIFVGYDIISATDTFSVYLVTQTEYQNLQNQQSFQYYTSFSKIDTQSARFLSAGVPANYFTEQLYLIIIAGVQNLNGITLMMNVRVLNGSPNTCVSGSCPCSVNSCNSQGLCATDATGGVFPLCSCFTGYSGSQCSSYTCDTVVCGNHASCVGFETCSCDSGWIQTSSTNNPFECNAMVAASCSDFHDCSSCTGAISRDPPINCGWCAPATGKSTCLLGQGPAGILEPPDCNTNDWNKLCPIDAQGFLPLNTIIIIVVVVVGVSLCVGLVVVVWQYKCRNRPTSNSIYQAGGTAAGPAPVAAVTTTTTSVAYNNFDQPQSLMMQPVQPIATSVRLPAPEGYRPVRSSVTQSTTGL
jgi:hypothetical protein